jgi:hypothetical protein
LSGHPVRFSGYLFEVFVNRNRTVVVGIYPNIQGTFYAEILIVTMNVTESVETSVFTAVPRSQRVVEHVNMELLTLISPTLEAKNILVMYSVEVLCLKPASHPGIVVTTYKDNPTIEPTKNRMWEELLISPSGPEYISQMKYHIFWGHNLIPPFDQILIHFLNGRIRSVAEVYNTPVSKVGVGGKKDFHNAKVPLPATVYAGRG